MKTFAHIALPALLALAVPAVAPADDHFAHEVRERFGAPSGRDVVDCPAPEGPAATRCLRWQYDTGDWHAVFFFEPGSERLLAAFTWDEAHRAAIDTSDEVRDLLHAARVVAEP